MIKLVYKPVSLLVSVLACRGRRTVIEGGLADLPMLVASVSQLFIGSVLESEQGVIRTRHS